MKFIIQTAITERIPETRYLAGRVITAVKQIVLPRLKRTG